MKRVTQISGQSRAALTACAVALALAACAPIAPPVEQAAASGAGGGEAKVLVQTLPAYRDTVDDARANGAVWQGTSRKAFARVSQCTARGWKKKLPYAHLLRQKAGPGQTLQLTSDDDGVLAVLELAPHRPGSEGALYLGSAAPQALADAVRECL